MSAAKNSRQQKTVGNVTAPECQEMGQRRSPRRTIGRAASEVGIHVETIRYYERLGLIARPVALSGYREYTSATVDRLRFIKQAQSYGFTLREIGELAGMADADASCEQMCQRMDGKIAELDAEIRKLSALRDDLRALVGRSPRKGSHTNCAAFGKLAGVAECETGCE